MRITDEIRFAINRFAARGSNLDASEWNKKNNIFIISTGRTGTHFFAHFINENFADGYAVHEPKKDVFILNNYFARKQLSEDEASLILSGMRKGMLHTVNDKGASCYVESNNNLSFLIPVLRKVFGNYLIIHLVRDGREIVRSLYSKKIKGRFGRPFLFMADNDQRDRVKATFFPDDPYAGKWSSMSRFEKICWYWDKVDGTIYNSIQHDERAITLTFESLFKDKNEGDWKKFVNFTGLKPRKSIQDMLTYLESNRSNEVTNYELPEYDQWNEEQKNIFDQYCGKRMKAYGYI